MSKVFKAAGDVVSGAFKAVGSIVTGVVNAVSQVVSSVVNFVVSPFMSLFGAPDMPGAEAEAERQQGVLVQQTGSNVNVPVVYGYRKVGGAVVYAETGSTNNKYLWVAYVFAEGIVEGLHEMFMDDNQLPASIVGRLNAGETVDIAEGKYNGRVRLQWYPGVMWDNPLGTGIGANSILKESPSWKPTNGFNGLATLFARYEWKEIKTQEDSDNNPFSGNIPEIQISLLGRKVASLTVSDPAGQGEWEEAPIRYSTNPAEILLDYLRSPTYGKGLSNAEIDWDSFATAAAKCNQQVTYVTGISGPILTCNFVVDTSQTIFNNVKTLLTNMRAYLPYVQGKYKLKIEDAGHDTDILSGSASIVQTFDKDNIMGNITYTGIERSAKYNQVTVNYVDPDNKWSAQQVVFPESEAERLTYITQDYGREYKGDFTFSAITNYAIAKDMARLIFFKSRFQDSCSFTADSRAFELEPGDNIYIDANVLKFGTDPEDNAIPWRIVSIKLNDNYTFDIACVRNPDFMYPYARVGEIDLVLPTYIPKGASIEYPRSTRVPVGLMPPTNATAPPGFTGTASNPAPTDPTGATGGGNGGSTNSTSPNTPPVVPPITKPLNNSITIDRASYTVENGQIYGTIEFYQPDHPMYSGVVLYYKRNISTDTYWRTLDVTTVVGANQLISVKIGPLLNAPYSLKSRVKYSTGDSSTVIGTAALNVSANTAENPTDYVETAVAGWSLPTTPPPNARNTFWDTASATPILSSGQPTSPRTLSLTLKQDISQRGINGYVSGAKVYYKPSADTYWYETSVNFVQPYIEGIAQTVTLPVSFGVPSYPGNPGAADNYDFIIRPQYLDGTESTFQYRIMAVNVEYSALGAYSFNPFSEKLPANQGVEAAGSYEFVTVTNAPPGSVVDQQDMQISLLSIRETVPPSTATTGIRFFISPPNSANRPYWYGVRVYRRPVSPGSNPAFQVQDITPITANGVGEWFFTANTTHDVEYEYVLVPLVESSGKKEAYKCWYGRGIIHNSTRAINYPATGNWLQQMNFQLTDTSTALSTIQTSFPQTEPTVQVTGWARVQLDNGTSNYPDTGWYYELTFSHQHISNYEELHVYRRSIVGTAGLQNSITNGYYGIGQWEKITVTTTNGSGTVQVNLRSAIGYGEFNSSTSALPAGTGVNSLIKAQYSSPNNYKPVNPLEGAGSVDEFLIVVKANGAVSAKALRLTPILKTALTKRVDGLNPNKPTTVTVSDYNTYVSGWLRNLSEARAPIATNKLIATGYTQNWIVTSPLSGPSIV